MELAIAASLLLHPLSLLVLAAMVFAAVNLGSEVGPPGTRIAWQRLLRGMAFVFVAALLVAAVSSYISPEEARSFGVPPENYASALLREFLKLAALLTFGSILGCAAIGIPLTLALARRGRATVIVLVIASVPISLCVGFAVGLLQLSSIHLAYEVTVLVTTHALLAFSFAVGARLPWRSNPTNAE
jgi:hypothetical protein